MLNADECLLIVDGLALSVTTENVIDLFAPLGGLRSVRLATDPFGCSLGFAHVVIATKEQALGAVAALDGHSLGGRMIRVIARELPLKASSPHLRSG